MIMLSMIMIVMMMTMMDMIGIHIEPFFLFLFRLKWADYDHNS